MDERHTFAGAGGSNHNSEFALSKAAAHDRIDVFPASGNRVSMFGLKSHLKISHVVVAEIVFGSKFKCIIDDAGDLIERTGL